MLKRKKVVKETAPELDLLDLKIIEMLLNDRRECLMKKFLKSKGFPSSIIHSICQINTTVDKIEKLIQIAERKYEYQ